MADSYSWDKASGRFRNDTTGRYVSPTEVRAGVDVLVDYSADRLRSLAESYRDGSISIEAYRDGLFAEIKSVHIAASLAGYGGRNAMNASRWGHVGARIKSEYQYARGLLQDIIDGSQPINGRLTSRTAMYANAGRSTYEAVRGRERNEAGDKYERSVLHAQESCTECVTEASRGWVPIGELVPIGERRCLSNCRCTMEYSRRARSNAA